MSVVQVSTQRKQRGPGPSPVEDHDILNHDTLVSGIKTIGE